MALITSGAQVGSNLKRLDAEISEDVRKSKSFNLSMVGMKAMLDDIMVEVHTMRAEAASVVASNEQQVSIKAVYQGTKGLLNGLEQPSATPLSCC